MDQTTTTDIDLHDATDRQLLLHGLAVEGEEPQGVRVLLGARQEVGVLAELAERSQLGVEADLGELAATLEGIGRRLDVGLELIRREREQPATAEAAAEQS